MKKFKFTGKGKSWSINPESYLNKHGVVCIDIDCLEGGVAGLATVYHDDRLLPYGETFNEDGLYNSRLIVCAPEMLELLTGIVDKIKRGSKLGLNLLNTETIEYEVAIKLIKKATTI